MSRFVIAAFKPKPGMQQPLLAVVEKHWRVLQAQGLVTDRPRYAMQAGDRASRRIGTSEPGIPAQTQRRDRRVATTSG